MDRELIINSYSKSDFMNYLSSDNNGKILELFNDEGINIIKNNKYKEDKICYILTYSFYKNELLHNINFLDVFLNSDITYYYAVLNNLNYDTYNIILSRCIELNKDPEVFANIFSYFNIEYKLKALNNWNYSKELLYYILKVDEASIIQKIINNYDIDLLSHNINLRNFFSNAKESVLVAQAKRNTENKIVSYIEVPTRMITKEMGEKIWNQYDIFGARAIINDAEYCTDASLLNNYIKYKEDKIISNYDNLSLLSPFEEIYEAFKNYKLAEKNLDEDTSDNYDIYVNLKNNFITLIKKIGDTDLYYEFNKKYEEYGLKHIQEYLKKLSDNSLSNYIIDYLFEENYHNIMLDVRELLNFYYRGNIVIPEERIELYNKISNIDYLPNKEKIQLYTNLKKFNIIEMFYDDMSMARHIVAEAIKEYSLSSQTIKQYKDEQLSKKYGVDVYNLNGNTFFGIVKTGTHQKDSLPAGHSYSLIGDGGLTVFGDPKDSSTFLYDSDDMNPEQLIHVFPFDSFTYYHPFEHSSKATSRVNTLLTPEELVNISKSYKEILVLERGTTKTDIDNSIPELKRIALYCLDEIREQDIRIAKDNGIGIILIDSSKYKQSDNKSLYAYRHDIDNYEYDYFNGYFEKEKFEARR